MVGMNIDAITLDTKVVVIYAEQAKQQGTIEFLLDIIPGSMILAYSLAVTFYRYCCFLLCCLVSCCIT